MGIKLTNLPHKCDVLGMNPLGPTSNWARERAYKMILFEVYTTIRIMKATRGRVYHKIMKKLVKK